MISFIRKLFAACCLRRPAVVTEDVAAKLHSAAWDEAASAYALINVVKKASEGVSGVSRGDADDVASFICAMERAESGQGARLPSDAMGVKMAPRAPLAIAHLSRDDGRWAMGRLQAADMRTKPISFSLPTSLHPAPAHPADTQRGGQQGGAGAGGDAPPQIPEAITRRYPHVVPHDVEVRGGDERRDRGEGWREAFRGRGGARARACVSKGGVCLRVPQRCGQPRSLRRRLLLSRSSWQQHHRHHRQHGNLKHTTNTTTTTKNRSTARASA